MEAPEHNSDRPRRDRASRRWRKRFVLGGTEAVLRHAASLPDGLLDLGQRAMHAFMPLLASPFVGGLVRRQMRAAGVHRVGAEHDYLRQAALHLAKVCYLFKYSSALSASSGGDGSISVIHPVIEELARRRYQVNESLDHLDKALKADCGVIVAPAHATQFLIGLPRLAREFPLTVYLRHSNNEAAMNAKIAWCRAGGLEIIAEPSRVTDPAARAARLAEALQERRILVITPDIPQPVGRGVPVALFGRHMQLAAGVSSLAILTGAPVVPLMVSPTPRHGSGADAEALQIDLHAGLCAPSLRKGRGWRQAAMQSLQQDWTDLFAASLRRHPHLWWSWLDNRWARVLSNDPKFAAPVAVEG